MRAQILRKQAFFVGKQSVSSQLLVNVTKLFVQKDKYIYIYICKETYAIIWYDETYNQIWSRRYYSIVGSQIVAQTQIEKDMGLISLIQ